MTFDINKILREHIRSVKPYSSARDEYTGSSGIFLDANENPYGTPGVTDAALPLHRYPDPYQVSLKKRIAEIKEIDPDYIFLGNGSDEAIDLIIRACCEPGKDNIIINAPTYGMYSVAADINQVEVRQAMLTPDFQLDEQQISEAMDTHSKLLFFCSPNNPTGNLVSRKSILQWTRKFSGLVVVDEAYIDFADAPSLLSELRDIPNLLVLQTLSKAWGMAALRLGMAFGSPEIIQVLNKIKPPYNINGLTQQKALEVLEHPNQKEQLVSHIIQQRHELTAALKNNPLVIQVYPSDANFLLVKIRDAKAVFQYLIAEKIIVRDRSQIRLCEDSLRITVGTEEENRQLLEKLAAYNRNA